MLIFLIWRPERTRTVIENKDDILAAVLGLDQFTKNYCMNVAETEKRKDLVFRCEECEFLDKSSNQCKVKMMVFKLFKNDKSLKDYEISSFGSMGSL